MNNEWTLEEQADFERFAVNIGELNTPKIEAWLACTNGEFLDLKYDPADFGETAGFAERLHAGVRRLLRRLRDAPAQLLG